jgi:hypothetical protein
MITASISGMVARASALLLAVCGVSLLFAADVILPRIAPGISPDASWFGQLLAAAWLGLAALNWLTRSSVLGGIYGRPIVLTNTTLYFVSAMVLINAATRGGSIALWVATAVAGVMAFLYGSLMFRGPR